MILRQTSSAMVVKRLEPGGPAEASGCILPGDVVLKVSTERKTPAE